VHHLLDACRVASLSVSERVFETSSHNEALKVAATVAVQEWLETGSTSGTAR